MYRIDKFLTYYHSLHGVRTEIERGVWVNARPLPFYNGIFTRAYWKERKKRRIDAMAVLRGEALAVTWERDI